MLKLQLPEDRKKKILDYFKVRRLCKIKEFAQFIGTFVAAYLATNYGWDYLKLFERQKYLALVLSGNNYEAQMEILT
ncbi:hypothetical protein P5V15_002695 [Pogonomyrmex californicus]